MRKLIIQKLRSRVGLGKGNSPMLLTNTLLLALLFTGCVHPEDQGLPTKNSLERAFGTRIVWNNGRIRAATVVPVTWAVTPESAGQVILEPDGTVIHPREQKFAALVSNQQFTGNSLIEYTILERGVLYSHPGYVAIVPAAQNAPTDFLWANANDQDGPKVLAEYSRTPTLIANKGDVFGIEIQGQTVKYYRNKILIRTSAVPFTFSSYKIRVFFNGFQDAAISAPSVTQT